MAAMTDDEKAALADVYERAAEYLEEYGWRQISAGRPGEKRCFIGATASACGQSTLSPTWDSTLWRSANDLAAEVLEVDNITKWNDEKGRTADEVINTLHGLANKLR